MEQKKTSAPALERGIRLLDLLGNGGTRSLEDLVRRLDVPKSSVLRLAETLETLGIIERNENGFRARYVLTALDRGGRSVVEIVRAYMAPLSDATACTVEWYVPDPRGRGFQILERAEPEHASVFLRARIGFLRALDVELEAVTALGLALGYGRLSRDKPLWVRKDGVDGNVYLDFEEARARIAEAEAELFAEDTGFNIQGIRRMAAAVTGKSGMAGILALAQSYTPDAVKRIEKNAALLREAAGKIQDQIRHI